MSDEFTEKQWEDWKNDPITQIFFEYVRQKKFDVTRYRLGLLESMPDPTVLQESLAHSAGIAKVLQTLQDLTFEELVVSLDKYKEAMGETRKKLKEQLGVDL